MPGQAFLFRPLSHMPGPDILFRKSQQPRMNPVPMDSCAAVFLPGKNLRGKYAQRISRMMPLPRIRPSSS